MQQNSLIRRVREDDLEQILLWRNSYSIRRYMFNQNKISFKDHKNWFKELSSKPNKHHLLIFEKNGIRQGFVSFNLGDYKVAAWGFYKAPTSKKGIGSELGRCALNYAFSNIQVHKVTGRVIEYNKKSIDFHKKLKFEQESILQNQYSHLGQYYNVICFGLSKKNWGNRV